jgi:hypothetical protein
MSGENLGVLSILTDAEVEILRQGYQPAVMMASTREAVAGLFPPGAGYAHGMVEAVYPEDPAKAKARETCLVAVLCDHHPAELAIHIYWGLMVGLTREEIGYAILVTGGYTGIAKYTVAMLTAERTFKLLKKHATDPALGKDSATLVGGLLDTFWGPR